MSVVCCFCLHNCGCVCACVWLCCLFIWSFICLLSCFSWSFLLPFCSLPSISHRLPPHVAPSPVDVDTERPKFTLLTPHISDQLPGLYFGNTFFCPSLYHVNRIRNELDMQHWLFDRKMLWCDEVWKKRCTVKVWNKGSGTRTASSLLVFSIIFCHSKSLLCHN